MSSHKKLAELYHDETNPAYLGSKDQLKRSYILATGQKPNLKELADFLMGERAYNEFKPRRN